MNSKKGKNHYLRLVGSDIRITSEDLKLLFEKDLEHTSSYWIFVVGALVGILTFALGNVTALGPNALSTYAGKVATVVSLTAFAGIMLFLYVVNWEMVSRRDFRYYLEAREVIDKRTQITPQSPTPLTMSATGTTPMFDKDIELKKIDLVAEELRIRYYTALGVFFSMLIAIVASLISFSLTASSTMVTVSAISLIALVALVLVGAVVALVTLRTIREYREIIPQLDTLLEEIESGHGIGSVQEA